jgi:nitrogen-specific signal transduction histidine kinase
MDYGGTSSKKPGGIEQSRVESSPHIASEINNALTVILGNAQLLQVKDAMAPDARAKLKAIVDSSVRIHTLMEELFQDKTRFP